MYKYAYGCVCQHHKQETGYPTYRVPQTGCNELHGTDGIDGMVSPGPLTSAVMPTSAGHPDRIMRDAASELLTSVWISFLMHPPFSTSTSKYLHLSNKAVLSVTGQLNIFCGLLVAWSSSHQDLVFSVPNTYPTHFAELFRCRILRFQHGPFNSTQPLQ